MLNAQRPLDGIGRAERHWVLVSKFFGIPAEITHFKALSATLPVIPRRQLCPEQSQGLSGELVHFRIESVVFQLAVQLLLFGLQFPPLYGIELTLQIGNNKLWRTEEQFECIAIEPEHDGEFLQKA